MNQDTTITIHGRVDDAQLKALMEMIQRLEPTIQAAMEAARASSDAAAKAIGGVGDKAQEAGDKGEKSIGGLVGRLKSIHPAAAAAIGGIAALSAATVAVGALSLKHGAEASRAYAALANSTGAVGTQLSGLQDSFRNVAAASASSMHEVAQVMGDLNTRTGQTGPALEALTTQMLQLAKVSGVDAAQAIPLVTRMFGDWGVAVEDQAGKLDMLWRASQQTGVGVDELSRLVVQFGAPLRNFGFSIDEGITLLGRWQKEGVNTELVMGSLRIAAGKFAGAGIGLRDGLESAIVSIQKAGSSSEATAIAMEVFGARAGADMADTIRGGKFAIDELLAAIEGGSNTIKGAAGEAAGLSGQFAKLHNAAKVAVSPLTDLFFDVGTKLLGALFGPVTDGASDVGNMLAPLADNIRSVVMPKIEELGASLQSAFQSFKDGGGIERLQSVLPNVAAGFLLVLDAAKGLGSWLMEHQETIKAVVVGVGLMAAVLGGVLLVALGAVAVAVGALAIPFVALGGLLVSFMGQGEETAAKTEGVGSRISAAWQSAKDAVSGAVGELWSSVQGAWDSGVSAVEGASSSLLASVTSTWQSLKSGVSSTAASLWAWLSGAFSAGVAFLLQLKQRLATGIRTAWTWISTTVSGLVQRLLTWVAGAWSKFSTFIGNLLSRVGTAFGSAWAWISNTVSGVVQRLADGVVALWHKAGQLLGQALDVIQEAFRRGWNAVLSIFNSLARPILSGIAALFAGAADLAKRGMLAVGGIVDRVMSSIVKKIADLASALGPVGGAIAGIAQSVGSSLKGWMSSLGSGLDGLISGIKGGVGGAIGEVTGFFSQKVQGAQEKVASLFAGGPGTVGQAGKETASAFDAGDLGAGGGLDLGALGGGGSGGAGPQGPLQVGDTGTDRQGDFYIDENGQKVYTSGAGLAKQNAKERAAEEKQRERDAKKGAAAEKAKAAQDAAQKKAAASLAKTVADTAEKVAEAVQRGLDVLRDLVEGDMPNEADWRPRLDTLVAFVGAAVERFRDIGKTLSREVGVDDSGAAMIDTAAMTIADGAAKLSGSVVDAAAKASVFLQSLVRAKFPEPGKVEAVMGQIGQFLERVRDESMRLAEPFMGAESAGGGEGEGGGRDPIAAFTAVGQGLTTWGDLWLKVGEGAIRLGENSDAVARAPAALATVGDLLDGIAQAGGSLVTRLRAAVPDEEEQAEMLYLSREVAATEAAWVDVVGRMASMVDGLLKVPSLPGGLGSVIERFFMDVATAGGALVRGVQRAFATAGAQQDALELSRDTADTMDSWITPVGSLAKAVLDLRNIVRLPEGTADAVGRFWHEIASAAGVLFTGLSRAIPDRADQAEALAVSRALSEAVASQMDATAKTAEAIKGLSDLPDVPSDAVSRVQAVWRSVSGALAGMLVGPGYNLLRDTERTVRDFAVVKTLIDILSSGIDLTVKAAGLGKQLAGAEPVSDADVERALEGAGRVRDLVTRFADAYRKSLDDAGRLLEDVRDSISEYKAILELAVGTADAAAKVKISDIEPLDQRDLDVAMANGRSVIDAALAAADAWRYWLSVLGLKIEDVKIALADYAAVVKDAIGIADAAAKLSIGDLEPLDEGDLAQGLQNATTVGDRVRIVAERWRSGLLTAGRKIEDVKTAVRDYAEHVKDTIGVADAAAKFGLADVKPLDPGLLDVALANAELARSRVAAVASRWAAALAEAGRKIVDVATETEAYSKLAAGAADLATKAGALAFESVKVLSEADIGRVLANAGAVMSAVAAHAAGWARAVRAAGLELETVVRENETYVKVVGAGVEMVSKVVGLMRDLGENGSRLADVMVFLPSVRQHAIAIVRELALVYDAVQAEGDRLKKAQDVSAVLSPAADALGKVLGALSLETLMKSPLVDTKLRSGFMSKVAQRRLDALAKQITDGVRRTVQALVEGLSSVTVPDGLGDGLDRIASVYERLIALLERVSALAGDVSADKVREIVAQARLLIDGLDGLSGGDAGTGGGRRAPAGPGEPGGLPFVLPNMLALLGASTLPPLAHAGAVPIGPGGFATPAPAPGLPVQPPTTLSMTLNLTQPVVLDGAQIGEAVERTVVQRNLAVNVAPQGS